MNRLPRDYLALALDNCADADAIQQLVRETCGYIGVFKIGLEQFTRFGPDLLGMIREVGRKIFLDLKLHDIPNTVRKAVGAAAEHSVDYLTVHTQGGLRMLEAAMEASAAALHPPTIVGVTLLTSIEERALREELGVVCTLDEYVKRLAALAVRAKLGGIVCSAADLPSLKQSLPAAFEIVTPGIRMAQHGADDQKRVATPETAIAQGSKLLVIGRPITAAPNPREAAEAFEVSVAAALEQRGCGVVK